MGNVLCFERPKPRGWWTGGGALVSARIPRLLTVAELGHDFIDVCDRDHYAHVDF